MAFRGIPAEAFEFYDRLEADNSRAFWSEHKSTYDECVKAPMLELTSLLTDEFGPFHLFRPHRDVRFSKDKTPYKTQQGAVTEGDGGEMYYVVVSADGLAAGTGYYRMARDQLDRFYAAVADPDTGPAAVAAIEHARANGYEVGGSELKSAPRGYPKDHPRVELLRHKGVFAMRRWPVGKWMSSRQVVGRVRDAWLGCAPLTEWLNTNVGPSEAPPPDAE